MRPIPPDLEQLNPAQHRHLVVAIDTLERVLRQVAALAPERVTSEGVSVELLSDVSETQLVDIAAAASSALRDLQADRTRLDLWPTQQSLRQHLVAHLTNAAVLLMDTHASGLRTYGALDEVTSAAVDKWLEALGAEVQALIAAVSAESPPEAFPPDLP